MKKIFKIILIGLGIIALIWIGYTFGYVSGWNEGQESFYKITQEFINTNQGWCLQ